MNTVEPQIIRLTILDQKGKLKSTNEILIDPSPLGKSDPYTLEVGVAIFSSPTNVDLNLKIFTHNYYSFDDGSIEKPMVFKNVNSGDILKIPIVIKNLLPLTGLGIGFEVNTKSTNPGSYYLKTSRSFDVRYK
jgi:hypothetical protein